MNLDKEEILRRIEAADKRPEKVVKSKDTFVAALIGVVIAIVVGVSLIPMIAEARKDAPPEIAGILDVLMYIFVAFVLLGAVAWTVSPGREEKYEEVVELSETDKIRQLQKKQRRHLLYKPVMEKT